MRVENIRLGIGQASMGVKGVGALVESIRQTDCNVYTYRIGSHYFLQKDEAGIQRGLEVHNFDLKVPTRCTRFSICLRWKDFLHCLLIL